MRKTWQEVSKEDFDSHLHRFSGLKSEMADGNLVHYIVNDTGKQWVAKEVYGGGAAYYIAAR